MTTARKVTITLGALAMIGGGLFVSSLFDEPPEMTQEERDRIMDPRLIQSAAERFAEEATEDWPQCAEGTDEICASWSEEGFDFSLVAIRSGDGETPVIESTLPGKAIEGRVLIHLTGGPMGPTISGGRDWRTELFEDFYNSGFTIASVGYWGTRFRTMVVRNEITYAGKDLARVYDHYKSACDCEPSILATSFGAGVALYSLREGEIPSDAPVLLLSPVLPGFKALARRNRQEVTDREREVSFTRTFLYHRSEDGGISIVGPRIVQNYRVNEAYARDHRTDYDSEIFTGLCSKAMVGLDDFRMLDFDRWGDPKIIAIEGAGHNLAEDAPTQLSATIRSFMDCHLSAPG